MLRLFKIETKKYRGLPVFRLLLVAVAMSLIFSCIQIFDVKSAADLAKITKLYAVFDNAAVVKIIVQPIILASLASIAVQVENRHKMVWVAGLFMRLSSSISMALIWSCSSWNGC